MSEFVPDPDDREPLRRPALWTALATAGVGVLVGYGVPIPDDTRPGLITLVTLVGPLVVWAWGRRRAWSGATVADLATRPERDVR